MSFQPTKTVLGALGIMLGTAALLGVWSQDAGTFVMLAAPILITATLFQQAGLLRF